MIVAARFVLAAVFLVAATAKLRGRAGFRDGLVAFGVPAPAAGPLGAILVVSEFAAGAALIVGPWPRAGAFACAGLLVVFSLAIALNLARGRRPACNCFGQFRAKPIGLSTLARNAVLVAIAAAIASHGQDGGTLNVNWFFDLPLIERTIAIVEFAAIAGILVIVREIVRQQGRMLRRIDALDGGDAVAHATTHSAGLPPGTPAPGFALPSLEGPDASLESIVALGKPVMLVFSNPSCGPCEALLPEVARWQRDYASVLTVALITQGDTGHARREASLGMTHVLVQADREIAELYGCAGTPGAVIVAPTGHVASYVAQGADAIRALIAELLDGPSIGAHASPLSVGDRIPAVAVEMADGTSASLPDLVDGETVLISWNPDCGFCERMLPELVAWERDRAPDAPRIVIVSTGTGDDLRAMNVQATIVRDPQREAAAALGTNGTPMARRIGSGGLVASEIVAGKDAILNLLRTSSGSS